MAKRVYYTLNISGIAVVVADNYADAVKCFLDDSVLNFKLTGIQDGGAFDADLIDLDPLKHV